jgi:hypothetical protein
MPKVKLSPVAKSIPFDNATFNLDNSPANVQDAIQNLVKPFGTTALSLTGDSQATAASTKTLVRTSSTVQIFTGTTAGQILKLPDATTLAIGHVFDIWNLSTQTIDIQNNANVSQTILKANANTKAILTNNGTAAGTWALSYTLDNGNVFGTQLYFQAAEPETSTTSTTTFLNKITLSTPSLPLGNYICQFQFIWRSSNASRSLDVRVQRAGANIQAWQPFTANLADRQLLSGFVKVDAISGAQTFTLDFKVSGTATTVFMKEARLFVWRVG